MRKREMQTYPLAQKVLAVAVVNYEDDVLFDWACYIDAVPGVDHKNEIQKVADYGMKQPIHIAHTLFRGLPSDKYR